MRKRNRVILRICMTICLALGLMAAPKSGLTAQAAEIIATVQGKVLSDTTSDLLYLSTNEGVMQIKLDSGTDTSGCKVMLPDTEISVSVSHGSDGYLHAVKVSGERRSTGVTLDSATTATVSGTLGGKTSGDVLYIKTAQGDMEIKFDPTTDVSGCSLLIVGRSYYITCARGSDAYMHATSISDTAGGASTTTSSSGSTTTSVDTSITPAPSGNAGAATATVTGEVKSQTTEKLLYLSTNYGEMQFAIDSSTDSRNGMVLAPGNKLTVSFYHGSDGYLHAVTITGTKKNSSSATIDTSSPATVSGTVGDASSEDILFLDTPQGMMELKLDGLRSVSGCKVFVSGKKLTVVCAYGSDAYMHALDITAQGK